ncbi:YihY/virulence factor BrkB family protein [Streptomyces sp. NBC_00347]|uniref:YihY/virulence factor BrkB family protein n=1 Tax=Streptomyces sp. NBC_00347 TaxID=2975721 RepID=UPI002257E4CA|nr:YhjD/YihY/BrkB family envelope integrity protein [Streptomyces sp. NBC_00347]MCX5123007.1 YihY/virulence factor BrkB family protein [Streptomyces sp. NBC_00347]
MDWLTKLPLIGPLVSALMRTHLWRSYQRLDRVHWSRLAAAITFISFLALFPLITVAAAVGAGLLTQDQLDRLQKNLAEQVPGISDQLDINALVANASTVGLIAAAVLLFTGIGWVGSMRDCLRAVWEKDDEDEGNPFVRKGKDALVLIGLGGVGLASAAASIFGSSAVGKAGDWLHVPRDGAGGGLLRGGAFLVGVLAAFLLLLYVLTLLPGVEPPRRRLIEAALLGAAGFELLKLLLSGYMREVATKSMYGAFGVPIALLIWINLTAKLLLFCAAWTASRDDADGDGVEDPEPGREPAGSATPGPAAPGSAVPGSATPGSATPGREPGGRAPAASAG